MAKQLLEINKFMNGTVTTPDISDTPEQSASYSINLDPVVKDGSLQSVQKNRVKYVYDESGTAGGLEVDIDKIKLIRSEDKVDAVYYEDDAKKIHYINDIDKNSTISSGDIATTTTSLDKFTDFKSDTSNTGYSVDSTVELKNVAMQSHSKEVHIGLGMNQKPKWVGYTNHKQFGTKLATPIIENAEVKYPSAVPHLIKVVTVSGSTYGVSRGGTRIWNINSTTGALIGNSDAGTFQNLQSICTDGTALYVLDRQNTASYKSVIHKVATNALSTKVKIMGLPTTYPGPSGSQYTDIEYTSTGTKLWVACHYDDGTGSTAAGDNLLFNFTIPGSNNSTVSLDPRMPRTSGGNLTTLGSWFQIETEDDNDTALGDFSITSNPITETFSRSLIKHPSENGAVFWLARYGDYEATPGQRIWENLWLNKALSSVAAGKDTISETAALVAQHGEIRTLCLNRITEGHTNGDSVQLTMVDHPGNAGGPSANYTDLLGETTGAFSKANITSCGLDPDNKLLLTIDSTVQRFATALDNTWTSLSDNDDYELGAKTETAYNVTPSGQETRTGISVNIGHLVSNDIVLLRQDGAAGLDKISKSFSANSAQTFLKDYSAVSLAFAAASTNTGELQANYEYFYKASFLFDGYQESNLCTEVFAYGQGNDQKNSEVTFTIADTSQIPRRASDVILYRAESPTASATTPDSLYRLVKQIPLDTVWTTTTDGSTGVTSATLTIEDKGTKLASFEANSELAQDLEFTLPNYSLSAQINNYHFIAKCKHPRIDDASTYVFRSKVGKFDTFDWLLDFVKLPTVPTAIMAFNGRIWAFDDANTYRIEPNNMFIEDIYEGVGCLNSDAIVSTDFGMFFADDKNIYHLTSGMAEPIGEAIVRGSDSSGGNKVTAWQERNKGYHTRATYDPTRRSVYFSFKGSDNNFYVWSWNIPRKRWDLLNFTDADASGTLQPKGVCTLDSGEIFWASDDTASSNKKKLKHFLGHASDKRKWTWISKSLTMGNDTQQKRIKDILSTDQIKINKTTDGGFPTEGSQLPAKEASDKGVFRLRNVNEKVTGLRVRLDSNSNTDTCSAISVLFKTKRSPR